MSIAQPAYPAYPALYVAEPSAQYLQWPPLVIDCCLLAGLLFHETMQADAAARISGKVLHAPYLIQIEMTSVALKKCKLGQSELAALALAEFDELAIQLHEIDPNAVLNLAIRYKLSTYDASYLWLAAELKAPLATFDEQLGRAAQVHLASLT